MTNTPTLINDSELIAVLQSSIYPGAKESSIRLVIDYCRAGKLDPMQKPVHIVPMSVSTGRKDDNGWDIKEMRDVIMPGVGLYRTQASRTGQYLGHSEPEFGPTKVLRFTEKVTEWVDRKKTEREVPAEIEYPEWCKVTIRRQLPGGQVAEFTVVERWLENYATKSNKDNAPNAMWRKRPFAQLAKCANAQALREAFPELGAQPTAEEMEGKVLDGEFIDHDTQQAGYTNKAGVSAAVQRASAGKQTTSNADVVDVDIETGEVVEEKPAQASKADADPADPIANEAWITALHARAEAKKLPMDDVLKHFKLAKLEGITESKAMEIAHYIATAESAPF